MPVMRNPFRRAAPSAAPFNASSESVTTENLSQSTVSLADSGKLSVAEDARPPRLSSIISIPKGPDEDYKLSVVNDSGVYLPPSPPEKKSFWKKLDNSSITSKIKIPVSEEQFVIPRESFESYRRSFDISARSPVSDIAPSRSSFDSRSRTSSDARPNTRASLDVRPSRTSLDVQPSRLSLDQRPMRRGPHFSKNLEDPSEDAFEDVKLNDDARPKKRSIFARFGTDHTSSSDVAPASSGIVSTRSGLFGKKEVPQETVLESELKSISNGVKRGE